MDGDCVDDILEVIEDLGYDVVFDKVLNLFVKIIGIESDEKEVEIKV